MNKKLNLLEKTLGTQNYNNTKKLTAYNWWIVQSIQSLNSIAKNDKNFI